MKKIFWLLFLIVILLAAHQKDLISQFIVKELIFKDYTTEVINNEYKSNLEFTQFSTIDEFNPSNNNQFSNILYTILNSGMKNFSFYCMFSYKECINDFKDYIKYSKDVELINNYIHPYNSFDNILIYVNNFNKIELEIISRYSEDEINYINSTIDDFIKNNHNSSMSDRDKIKIFHDYIINNTKYDREFDLTIDKENYPYRPYDAYGLLTEKKAVCSGYSDIMAIYLTKIGIKNYKIASEEHVWNYLYVDDNWYHLDLTWDDPIYETDVLIYDFFLITTEELQELDSNKHNYDISLYLQVQ